MRIPMICLNLLFLLTTFVVKVCSHLAVEMFIFAACSLFYFMLSGYVEQKEKSN